MGSLRREADIALPGLVDRIERVWRCEHLPGHVLEAIAAQPHAYRASLTIPLAPHTDAHTLHRAWELVAARISVLRARLVLSKAGQLLLATVRDGLSWTVSSPNEECSSSLDESPPLSELLLPFCNEGPQILVWTVHGLIANDTFLRTVLDKVATEYVSLLESNSTSGPSRDRTNAPYTPLFDLDNSSVSNPKYSLVESSNLNLRFARSNQVAPGPDGNHICFDDDRDPAILCMAAWALFTSLLTASDIVRPHVLLNTVNQQPDDPEAANPTLLSLVSTETAIDWSTQTVLDLISAFSTEPQIFNSCDEIESTKSWPLSGPGLSSLLVLDSSETLAAPQSHKHCWQPSLQLQCLPYAFVIVARNALPTKNSSFDVVYDGNFLSHQRATEMSLQYQHLVHRLSTAWPETPLRELQLVSPSEYQRLCDRNADVPSPTLQTVHSLVELQATLCPAAPAVHSWDACFTYKQLNALSSQLAWHLVNSGVEIEDNVVLCFQKSAWAAVSMLATLKAGGAVVALDPRDSLDRKKMIIATVKAKMVLTDVSQPDMLHKFAPHTTVVKSEFFHQDTFPTSALPTVRPNNTAFIIFTSGSTGKPKGVVLEHSSICTSAEASGNAKHINEYSRVFQYSNYIFDGSIQDHFFTWIRGGCVCIPTEDGILNDLAGSINELRANWTFLTPSVVALLSPADLPHLQVLTLGGEALTSENVRIWAGQVTLQNTYGPAECSVGCCVQEYDGPDGDPRTIGFPIGCLAWIAHPFDHHQLVPEGCIGELLLESPMLARCYLSDTIKTTNSFLQNPPWLPRRSSPADCRVYKTGDLVSRNPDGSLRFWGRRDTEVKLRGQRIRTADLNDFFATQGTVKSAHVLVPLAGPYAQSLICILSLKIAATASVVGRPPSFLEPLSHSQATLVRGELDRLKEAVNDNFPHYMVATSWVLVEDLPLTPSGKIDSVRIRKWIEGLNASTHELIARAQETHASEEPRTRTERQMQESWSNVLNISPQAIGRGSSFFGLGGNSILAVRLHAALKKAGMRLQVSEILQESTLSDMAAKASLDSDSDTVLKDISLMSDVSLFDIAEQCDIGLDDVEDVYPATPFQEATLTLTAKEPGAYVVHRVFYVAKEVQNSQLHRAWLTVYRANSILRTRLVHHATLGTLQVVVKERLNWHETLSEARNSPKEINEAFTFGGPLLRLTRSGATLLLSMHHAIYDGWSLSLILDDVSGAYYSSLVGRRPSFKSYVRYLSRTPSHESEEFWRHRLSKASCVPYPALPEASYVPICSGTFKKRLTFTRPSIAVATPATFATAAWAIVLAQYTNTKDVCFGNILSGRLVPVDRAGDIIGPLVATVPLRVQLDRETGIRDLLREMHEASVEMIPHAHYGLHKIQNISSDTRTACSFSSIFLVNPTADPLPVSDILQPEDVEEANPADYRTYPLHVTCSLEQEGLSVKMRFDPAVVDHLQVESLTDSFEGVLKHLSTCAPDARLGEILQDSPESMGGTNSPYIAVENNCIQALIRSQAKSNADSVAICSSTDSLTYAELDNLSDRLSHRLRSFVIGPEVYVCFSFEKCVEAVVAIIAILKAGGVCVPLDVSYPPERCKFVVEKCQASVIVCSGRQHATLQYVTAAELLTVDLAFLRGLPDDAGSIFGSVQPNHAVSQTPKNHNTYETDLL